MHAMKLKRKIALILRTGTLNLYTCMFKVYCKPIFIYVPQTFYEVCETFIITNISCCEPVINCLYYIVL